MHSNDIRIYTAAAVSAVAVAIAAKECVRIHREEIQRNMKLDIQAIKAAEQTMSRRIERGEIRSVSALIEETKNEIAFAKIAIREDS